MDKYKGYKIETTNTCGRFTVVNYCPDISEEKMNDIKRRIVKSLQFVFINGTKPIDT